MANMKFQLVFENTGDLIPFEVVHNQSLMQYFVEKINADSQNSFSNNKKLAAAIDQKISDLHWNIVKSNEVLGALIDNQFEQKNNLEDYLDQSFLNRLHRDWVFSQKNIIDIDELRFSADANKAKLGRILHECYPDEIRKEKIAPILANLGYIYPYEEVNLSVHRLEQQFAQKNLEFSADKKWEVFPNPYLDDMVSNNDIVNFAFAYTYVGRQYHDKFNNFDDDLICDDHYNYETLEFSFQLNLSKPQTIPYSKEFLDWATDHSVKLITNQIPIGNIPDLATNLFEYRKILYRNSRDNNRVAIILN
jgi:hypothetical protein